MAAPLLLCLLGSGWALADAPVAVSPGGLDRPTRSGACPSFDWGRVDGALRYELVVYAVGSQPESLEEEDAVLAEHVPGSALGWTPSLDRCLAPGATYAWSVRAITAEGPTGWAPPLFFAVEEAPTREEILRVLAALRRRDGTPRVSEAPSAPGEIVAGAEPPVADAIRAIAPFVEISPPIYEGGGPAALRVKGEVRTVDASGAPRLWGRGRPGTLIYGRSDSTFCSWGGTSYGLSDVVAQWSSAADACPEGTWVCRHSELDGAAACDTARPDLQDSDYLACEGLNWGAPAHQHPGWLADADSRFGGMTLQEDAVFGAEAVCYSLPVWCCFD